MKYASVDHVSLRLQAFFAAINEASVIGTALRFTLLIVPWPLYTAVFLTCWDCYDFEAAAAHEIGHLLGLAHPDQPPAAQLERALARQIVSESPPNSTYFHTV